MAWNKRTLISTALSLFCFWMTSPLLAEEQVAKSNTEKEEQGVHSGPSLLPQAGSLSDSSPVMSWPQVYQQVQSSVPLIWTAGRVCSGALIDDRKVLTAAHCVASLRPIYVFWRGQYQVAYPAHVVGMDRVSDLALLRLSASLELPPLRIARTGQAPLVGEEIATIGHPTPTRSFDFPPFDIESTYLFSKGVVSRSTPVALVSDLSVSPGNSGGPALNTRGQVVGVVSKKRVDPGVGSISHIVPTNKLNQFIQEHQGTNQVLDIWQASSSVDLSLWLNNWNQERPPANSGKENVEWDLSLLLFDRLMVSGGLWLGGERKRDSIWSLGWRFEIVTRSLSLWAFTPAITQWHNQAGETNKGISLSLDPGAFPFTLRYTKDLDARNPESFWSIGLRLF